MAALDKDKIKHGGFLKKWDTTKHIAHYTTNLVDFVEQLQSKDINTSNNEEVMAMMARMYKSEFFTERTSPIGRKSRWQTKSGAIQDALW